MLTADVFRRVVFRRTDVSSWDDLVKLFEVGWEWFGSLDAVLSNAGINEVGGFLEDTLDPSTGSLQAPNLQTLNVNLLGQLYTTKLAMHYFGKQSGKRFQLVLTGSAAW